MGSNNRERFRSDESMEQETFLQRDRSESECIIDYAPNASDCDGRNESSNIPSLLCSDCMPNVAGRDFGLAGYWLAQYKLPL